MITINPIKFDVKNSRVSSALDIDGKKFDLWFEVDLAYAEYLLYERGDAFVIGVLPYALRNNHDITCTMPCTMELIYSINEYLLPSLVKYEEQFYNIKIICVLVDEPIKNAGAVGCGLSCGVDSLYSIYRHMEHESVYLKLTHLVVFNNGSFGGYFQKTGWDKAAEENLGRDFRFAEEVNLPIVRTNSNLGKLIGLRMDYYVAYFMAFNVLNMSKLFKSYLYSSAGLDLSYFTVQNSDKNDCSNYDLLTLNCLSRTEGIRFFSSGMSLSRYEKMEYIKKWKLAHNYLHSCLTESFNCGVCQKCKRNLVNLDALEVLEDFSAVYDLEDYKNRRIDVLRWMCEQKAMGYGAFEYVKEAYTVIKKREPDVIKEIEDTLTIDKLIQTNNTNAHLQKKYRSYLNILSAYAVDNSNIGRIKEIFMKNHIHDVVLYGNTYISHFIYNVRTSLGLNITHIVEDIDKGKNTIVPRLPVSTVDYPKTDAIIICEVFDEKRICKKLSSRISAPIYIASELLPIKTTRNI